MYYRCDNISSEIDLYNEVVVKEPQRRIAFISGVSHNETIGNSNAIIQTRLRLPQRVYQIAAHKKVSPTPPSPPALRYAKEHNRWQPERRACRQEVHDPLLEGTA
jgi:hypothetical protein